MVAIMPTYLGDDAWSWYKGLPPATRSTYSDLNAAFLAQFRSASYKWLAQTELFSRRQSPTEGASECIRWMTAKASTAELDEPTELSVIAQGLLPTIKTFVITREPKYLEEVKKMCDLAEVANQTNTPDVTLVTTGITYDRNHESS